MSEAKFRIGFLSFFFFFQGVFLTGMILFAVFNNKVVPVMMYIRGKLTAA